jgi:hypothetical protein
MTVLSDDGTVEDGGTHADLMAAGGQYAGLLGATRFSNRLVDGDAGNYGERPPHQNRLG